MRLANLKEVIFKGLNNPGIKLIDQNFVFQAKIAEFTEVVRRMNSLSICECPTAIRITFENNHQTFKHESRKFGILFFNPELSGLNFPINSTRTGANHD